MKKIFFSLFAIAAIAACTKSEVAYEQPDAIGFQVVNGKMTKAAVEGTAYPEDLNMYVFAMTTDGNGSADYLDNAQFAKFSVAKDGTTNLWGGTPDPYYWPNVKKLHFAGVSKSGNVNNGAVPTYSAEKGITIDGYECTPGAEVDGEPVEGDNDLMWFPKTQSSYGKGTEYVPVKMYHACSWITIKMAGDGWTAGKYTITDIHIEGLTTKGKVDLAATASWTLSTDQAYTGKQFDVFTGSNTLSKDATAEGFEDVENNTIVLPNQVPGTLSVTYEFDSQAEEIIKETVTGSLKYDAAGSVWQPGIHYTYTVTITASQILIAPTVDGWDTPTSGDFDVEVQ